MDRWKEWRVLQRMHELLMLVDSSGRQVPAAAVLCLSQSSHIYTHCPANMFSCWINRNTLGARRAVWFPLPGPALASLLPSLPVSSAICVAETLITENFAVAARLVPSASNSIWVPRLDWGTRTWFSLKLRPCADITLLLVSDQKLRGTQPTCPLHLPKGECVCHLLPI